MATDHEKLVTSINSATDALEFAEDLVQSLKKKGKALPPGAKTNLENLSQDLARIMVSIRHISYLLDVKISPRKSKSESKSSSLSTVPLTHIVERDSP